MEQYFGVEVVVRSRRPPRVISDAAKAPVGFAVEVENFEIASTPGNGAGISDMRPAAE